MKRIDVNPSAFIDFKKENNKEGPKFKVGDHVRILKYKNIFAKDYVPNWSEEVFMIKKFQNTVSRKSVFSDFNGKEIDGTFYEKEFQKETKRVHC